MRKYKFLIVDDILMNRVLLKEIIREISESIKEAQNGLEAIKILEDNIIDVIFMDIEMPHMNGLETTKYIRSNFKFPKNRTPIIALTAHNPNDFFNEYNSAGFDSLITKPYSFDKLFKTIELLKK